MKNLKNHSSYLRISMLVLSAVLLTGMASCKEDDDEPVNEKVKFSATLNGANEVPANNSTATGTAMLEYDMTTKIFNLVVTFSGFDAISGHVHEGAAGVSGPPVFPFNQLTSPINYTSPPLTVDQEEDLFNSNYYVNLHSAAFPGGEIRGQLLRQP